MSTPSKRKPRAKKYASELSVKTARNMRRALVNEIAANAAAEYDRARTELSNAERRERNNERNRRNSMVGKGLTPRLRAAMHSWGMDLAVFITPSRIPAAYTDFKSITVCHDDRLTRAVKEEEQTPEPVSDTELRHIAAETRGMFYHEVGHNLFSVPLKDLLTAAWAEGYVPLGSDAVARVNDAGTLTGWNISSHFQWAWNALEDQRMESALVEESPQIAAYLTVMVLRLIVGANSSDTSWALVAGRSYLPDNIREAAKSLWARSGSRYSAHDVGVVIRRYVTAANARDMLECVAAMRDILSGLGSVGSNERQSHSKWERSEPGEAQDKEQLTERIQQTAQKTNAPSKDNAADDSKDSADAADDSKDSADDSGAKSPGQIDGEPSKSNEPGQGSSPGDDRPGDDEGDDLLPQDARSQLKEGLNKALDDLDDDQTLSDDMAAINDAYVSDNGALPLWKGVRPNSESEYVDKAHAIVDDIERAFLLATEDCAPRWESGQRRGVLDALRYSTRQPGDVEIFRNYSDHGDPASAIDVSLFLDISGSMMGTEAALGAAAWAVKVACSRIGIACDVALFNESGHLLWGVEEHPAYVPEIDASGGTNPSGAFDGLLTDERERRTHLVLILTDGAWSSGVTMAPWKRDNMHSVLFYYTAGSESTQMEVDFRLADQRRVDEAFSIGDLMDIPVALENILINLA